MGCAVTEYFGNSHDWVPSQSCAHSQACIPSSSSQWAIQAPSDWCYSFCLLCSNQAAWALGVLVVVWCFFLRGICWISLRLAGWSCHMTSGDTISVCIVGHPLLTWDLFRLLKVSYTWYTPAGKKYPLKQRGWKTTIVSLLKPFASFLAFCQENNLSHFRSIKTPANVLHLEATAWV